MNYEPAETMGLLVKASRWAFGIPIAIGFWIGIRDAIAGEFSSRRVVVSAFVLGFCYFLLAACLVLLNGAQGGEIIALCVIALLGSCIVLAPIIAATYLLTNCLISFLMHAYKHAKARTKPKTSDHSDLS